MFKKVNYTTLISSGIIIGLICLGGLIVSSKKNNSSDTTTKLFPVKKIKGKRKKTDNNGLKKIHENVMKRWTINNYLKKYGLTSREIYDIVKSAKKIYNLAKIKSGHEIDFYLSLRNSLEAFRYEIDQNNYLYVKKKGEEWISQKKVVPYVYRLSFVEGDIKDNLFNDMKEAGGGASLAINVSEIFAWDIDFYADLRKGDSFKVLFLKRFINGTYMGPGPIIAAEFTNQGVTYQAVRFKFPDGHSDYFTPDGKSLRKELLKSPLKIGHVTSRFSYHRFHPVLKIYRPHFGVDIAAPVGTPVHAAGDGIVVYAGRKGQAGKMIEIRHANGYSTQYLHLSRYARGIRRGVRVHQGQIIAYVGHTGVATGPHLDYRIKYRGHYVNPLKQGFKRAAPLLGKYLSQFSRYVMASLRVFGASGNLRRYYLSRLKRLLDKRMVEKKDMLVVGFEKN